MKVLGIWLNNCEKPSNPIGNIPTSTQMIQCILGKRRPVAA